MTMEEANRSWVHNIYPLNMTMEEGNRSIDRKTYMTAVHDETPNIH
jgi:hypothetical protein